MARPRKEIDKGNFEKLCGLQCTREEICCFFDVSEKTLEGWCKRTYHESFSPVFAKKRGTGKISLRRYQFELAKKNASMAIWLGKQYLGQKDVPDDTERHDGVLVDLIDGLKDSEEESYDSESGADGDEG